MLTWICFLASLAGSVLVGSLVLRVLRARQVLDVPTSRSSHAEPTVRGGGLAIMGTIAAALVVLAWGRGIGAAGWLLLPLGVIAGVSFLDDVWSIPAKIRLAVHFGAAALGLWTLDWPKLSLEVAGGFAWNPPFLAGTAIAVLWLAGFPNAFNFMDGINGHAAMQTVLTAGASAWIGATVAHDWTAPPVLMAAIIAGAAAGFLPYNFPRARMFMGDVGSVPLGFLMAFLALWQALLYGWELFLPLALLQFNFLFDASATLFRRILKGDRWLEPHREHFYERMAQACKSHTVVTGVGMAVQVVCSGLLVASVALPPAGRPAVFGGVVLLWFVYYVVIEIYCRRRGLGFRANHPQPVSDSP